jgi:signal transduction histidine kinase
MKSEFVAIASHELRTPLTSISGFAKTILERWETLTDGEKRRYLAIVDQQADRLRRLVNNVLLLARVEDQTMRPQPAPVPVVEVARAVLAERRAEDLFQLRVHEPALAHADPDHVHQILANYVANALAYGSPPYYLDIHRDEAVITVRVRDAGPGVADTFAQHSSRRSHAPRKDRQAQGSGSQSSSDSPPPPAATHGTNQTAPEARASAFPSLPRPTSSSRRRGERDA